MVLGQTNREKVLGLIVLLVFLYYFSPYARFQVHNAISDIDSFVDGIDADSKNSIIRDPTEYYGKNVTVHGNLEPQVLEKVTKGEYYIKSGDSKIEAKGCGLGDYHSLDTKVKIEATMDNYSSCDCKYEVGSGYMSDTLTRQKFRNSCQRKSDNFRNSRCINGTIETHHYLVCQRVLQLDR